MRIQKFKDGDFNLTTVLNVTLPLHSDGTPREALNECSDLKYEIQDAAKVAAKLEAGIHDFPDMRAHYIALNHLPTVVGTKWVVTEDVFNYFLEMLPPLNWQGESFEMSEAHSHTDEGVIRSRYYKSRGEYWHEYVLIPYR